MAVSQRWSGVSLALCLALFLSACEDQPRVVSHYMHPNGVKYLIDHAAREGTFYVQVAGSFRGLDQAQLKSMIRTAFQAASRGRRVTIVTEPEQAEYPEYRVVVTFNPVDFDMDAQCADVPLQSQPPRGADTVMGVFCSGGEGRARVSLVAGDKVPAEGQEMEKGLYSLARSLLADK